MAGVARQPAVPTPFRARPPNFAVTGGLGTISVPTAGATRSALLNSTSATDVDFSFSVRTDKATVGGNHYIYGVVRRNGTNEYSVKMRFATNGNVFVSSSQTINNTETPIGSEVLVPGLNHIANSIIRFRGQVTGTSPTTLRVRAWADGSAEPSTWQYTATNSAAALQVAGSLGLRVYMASGVTNAPVLFSFDDFRVTSIGGPNNAPVFSTEFGDRTDAEGAAPSFDANATDPDGNTLTYSATNLPAGMTINSSTGVVSGTLAFTAAGSYNVTLTVVRWHADRYRHLHLDGDQHQPATDLQHQLRRSHRRRGRRHQPRCRRHRSRRHGAHLLGHQPARWPHHQQLDRCRQSARCRRPARAPTT